MRTLLYVLTILFWCCAGQTADNYYNSGVAKDERGDLKGAIADYSKAIEINPHYFIAYNNRGNSYQHIGRHDLAIADYNKTIELEPENGMPYNNRGFTFLLLGELEKAEGDLRKSLELNENNIYALNSMAELYSARNNPDEACRWLKMAVQKGYNNWNYLKTSKTYDNIRYSESPEVSVKS